MNKRYIIALLLFLFSLFHTFLYYYYEGEHIKVTESKYKVRDNVNNHTSRIEKYAQMRIIYQAHKNIKMDRVFALSNIDDNTVANSYPIYQYYNFGISHILGMIMYITNDVVITYTVGIWLFSLLFVFGLYLLITKICHSRKTALLAILVFLTYPYFISNLITRYAYTEYLAVSMVPMLIYLFIRLLEKGNTVLQEKHWCNRIEYVFIDVLFVALGSLFLITHNITTLFTPVLLGIPLLVYIVSKIKPNLKSLLLLVIPFALMVLNSLFILVPVAQNQNTLLISGSFVGLLFANFGLNDLSVVTRIFPYTSPLSGQPFLTLQFGLPILLLAIAFFKPKHFHIYVLIGIVFWLVVSPTLWKILPPMFYVTQFSMRLFSYVPLLLMFAVRPLPTKVVVGLSIIALFFGFFFIQRPNSVGRFFTEDYDEFPSENQWNYRTIGQNGSFAIPRAVNPPADDVTPKKTLPTQYLIENLKNPEYKRKAVTYVITVPEGYKKELFISRPVFTFKDDRITQTYAHMNPDEDNRIVLSYCITNTKELSTIFEVPKGMPDLVSVKRLTEEQYMHIDPTLITASCDYEYKNNGQEYLFKLDPKFEDIQLLTVFYSPYNIVTGEDGKVLETRPMIDGAQRSYTAVMKRGDNKTIRVQLSAGNVWIPVSIFTMRLTLILFLVSGGLLLSQFKLKKHKKV